MTNYAPVVAVAVVIVVVVVVVVVVVDVDEVDAVLSGPYTHCGIAMTSNVLSVDVIIWEGMRVTGSARLYGV